MPDHPVPGFGDTDEELVSGPGVAGPPPHSQQPDMPPPEQEDVLMGRHASTEPQVQDEDPQAAMPAPPASQPPAQADPGGGVNYAPVEPVRDPALRDRIAMPVTAAPAPQGAPQAAGPDAPGFPEPLVIGPQPQLGSAPKGFPSEESAGPDTLLDGADLAGLTIRGASLRGDEHRYFGSTRQDSMGMWLIEEAETAALLVCATDGVGSQPLAHVGSRAACNMLPDEIRSERTLNSLFEADPVAGLPELCRYIAGNLGRRLADIARYRDVEVSPKAMSTTLVAAVVEASPLDPEQRRFVVFSVGDATAFLLRGGMFQPLLADPHDGVLMSTGTSALPTSIGHVATARGVLGPRDMLLVCTDGISNPMRNGAVRDQLAAWWSAERIPGLPEFGWQMSFRVKSYGDDRTAVCVWGR